MSKSPTLFDNLTSQNGHADVAPQSEKEYQDVKRLGRLPQDWSVRRIGECIVSLDAGTSVGGEDRQKHDGEKGILKVSAVSSGRLRPSEHKVVSPDRLDEVDTSPQEGRLIISRANTRELVGASAYVEADYSDLYLPDKLWQIQVDDRHVLPRWLHHILWTRRLRFNIGNEATGSSASMKNISQKRFKRLRIPVPPLDEQQRILNHLGTWDRVIEQVDALIEQKRERLHGLRQRLLTGEVRFPEFDEPWIQVKLGDVFSERDETENGHLDLLAVTMDDGVIPREQLDRRDTSSSDKSNYRRAIPGDLVYNSMRMWQGVSGIAPEEGIVSPAYTVCVPEDGLEANFVRHLFQHDAIINLFRRYSQGLTSDTWKLRFEHFAQIEVEIPSSEEQRQIAEVLDTAEIEINTLEEKRDALQRQKKGLMQRLLTGAVRTV